MEWQTTCGTVICSVAKLNGRGGSSPGCTSHFEKSMVRPLSRHGVPVLKRASSNPADARLSLIPSAELSPARPPTVFASPGVHDRLEERAGRQHHGIREVARVAAGHDADDSPSRERSGMAVARRAASPSTSSCRSVRFSCSSTHRFIVNW